MNRHHHWRERMHAAMHDYAEAMQAGRFGRHGRHGHQGHEHDGEGEGFGRGMFGGGRGGRALGHGDLRLLLLALIGEKPRHGYDLIRAIEERFAGGYAPSPGAVYPTLTLLEEQDLIRAEAPGEGAGTKKLFAITDEGRALLKENEAQVEGMFARIDLAAAHFARHTAPESVHEAWKTLRQAMNMRRTPWTEEEAIRVKAILEKAARDIVVKGDS